MTNITLLDKYIAICQSDNVKKHLKCLDATLASMEQLDPPPSLREICTSFHSNGGLSYGTVRNNSVPLIREFIDEWRNKKYPHNAIQRKAREIINPKFEDLSEVPFLLGRIKQLEKMIKTLKEKSNVQIHLNVANSPINTATSSLTSMELDSLKQAIDERHLNGFNLSIDKHGRIVSSNGMTIFSIGFANAIRKILATSEMRDSHLVEYCNDNTVMSNNNAITESISDFEQTDNLL